MVSRPSSIEQNLRRVRERIAEAALRAGRDPAEITLVAVTKTFPPQVILEGCLREVRVDFPPKHAMIFVAQD